jgi:pimeloyl-ACP methyl ester carboxylesterase
MSGTPGAVDSSIAARVRAEIERTIQRNIKGLEYLFSSDPSMGLTPKDTIYKKGTLQLYHYRPLSEEIYRVPVLLVMSLVSKYYILDLTPGQSFIEFLLKQGYDVYLIDWGIPRPEDRRLRLEDYILDFLPDCISRIADDSGEPDISMIGYCMGGMLAIMYSALYPDLPLKNLVMPHYAGQLRWDGADAAMDRQALLRRRSNRRCARKCAAGVDVGVVRHAAASRAHRAADPLVGQHVERRLRQVVSDVRSLGE